MYSLPATRRSTATAVRIGNASQLSGANTKHVDCDGSGSVNPIDVDAVSANYSQTHRFYAPDPGYSHPHSNIRDVVKK